MTNETEVAAWAAKLQDLLERGVRALRAEDPTQVAAVQADLRLFREESPDFADSLDREATFAILDLDLNSSAQSIQRIEHRNEAVSRIAKLIRGVSDEANREAAMLRLQPFREVVDSTTATIDSLKRLRGSLGGSAAHKAVKGDIESVIAKIQELRSKVELL